MIKIKEQDRLDNLKKLGDNLRLLYGSDELTNKVSELCKKYKIQASVGKTNELFGDTILGFHRTAELPNLLQTMYGVGADDSHRITAEMLEMLSPVIERETSTQSTNKEGLEKLAKAIAIAPTPQPAADEHEEPIEETETVQPLRTMASDMNRIHGYGAYRDQNPLPEEGRTDEPTTVISDQSDLLSPKKEPLVPVPSMSEPEPIPEPPAPNPVLETNPTPAQTQTPKPTVPNSLATQPAPAPSPTPSTTSTPPITPAQETNTSPTPTTLAPTESATAQTPVESDGSVRIPINSPLKSPDTQPLPKQTPPTPLT